MISLVKMDKKLFHQLYDLHKKNTNKVLYCIELEVCIEISKDVKHFNKRPSTVDVDVTMLAFRHSVYNDACYWIFQQLSVLFFQFCRLLHYYGIYANETTMGL